MGRKRATGRRHRKCSRCRKEPPVSTAKQGSRDGLCEACIASEDYERESHSLSISIGRKVLGSQRLVSKIGFIYFIETVGYPFVKIGFSESPSDRIESLRTASPFDLFFAGVWRGWLCDEKFLHDRFSHLQSHREWFRKEGELKKFLDEYGVKNGDGSFQIKYPGACKFCPVALEVEWLIV